MRMSRKNGFALPVHIVSAAGLVRRGDEVLLVRSPRRGWEFPCGQVEQGESVLAALLREIREETGVEARVSAFVGEYSNVAEKPGYGVLEGTMLPTIVNLTFLCEYAGGELQTSEESVEVEWVDCAQARRRVTFPPLARRLSHMLDYDGRVRFEAFRMTGDAMEILEEKVLQ